MMFVPLLILVLILDGVCSTHTYAYVGCHKDGRKRDIPDNYVQGNAGNPMTPETCSENCREYLVFGLQNGNECRCGMSYGRYQHRYGESECPETCQTQQDKKCGGRWRNSVYRHHFNFTSIVGTPLEFLGIYEHIYVGCYEDSRDRRDLTFNSSSTQMSIEYCNRLCQPYKYFGLESSDECYCGDKEVRVYDWSNECDEVCTGDSHEMCGGDWRMSVFRKSMLQANLPTQQTARFRN